MKTFFTFLLFIFFSSLCFCAENISKLKVALPGGAPSVALAVIADSNLYDFSYIASETVAAEFASSKADFIVAPVNAGAKLFNKKKSQYKLAAVITWGNLYFASQKKNFKLSDIKQNGITLFGENTINSSVAIFLLEKCGYKTNKIEYLAGAAGTQALLLSDKNKIVMTAEPALSAAAIKNPEIFFYSLNELCKTALNEDGFAQAGIFVKEKTAENYKERVDEFLYNAEKSCNKCNNNLDLVAEICVKKEILPNKKIALSSIPNCAIRFVKAIDAKTNIQMVAEIDLSQFGDEIPSDDFYYE